MSREKVEKLMSRIFKEIREDLTDFFQDFKDETLESVSLAKRETQKRWKFWRKNTFGRILKEVKTVKNYPRVLFCVVATGGTIYLLKKVHQTRETEEPPVRRRTTEKTFLTFASVEYRGQIYMTPIDFIDSILETHSRITRSHRYILSDKALNNIHNKTPSIKNSTPHFFRDVQNNAIISYSDYLFLLSVLIKPHSDLMLTFKMLDTNDSETLDKEEYLVMEKSLSRDWKLRHGYYKDKRLLDFSQEELVDDEFGLQRKKLVLTTLMVHFFGKEGTQLLNFEDFKLFVLNFQKELLELEFAQFSNGLPFITETDLTKILLRYSVPWEDNYYENYIKKLMDRHNVPNFQHGVITFEEYINFIMFLHKMEDFYYTLKFYIGVKPVVTRNQFHDTFRLMPDHGLTWHLIDTLFTIFDVKGNGTIDYQFFVDVLKERLQRGFGKKKIERNYWSNFKRCVKRNLRHESEMNRQDFF